MIWLETDYVDLLGGFQNEHITSNYEKAKGHNYRRPARRLAAAIVGGLGVDAVKDLGENNKIITV